MENTENNSEHKTEAFKKPEVPEMADAQKDLSMENANDEGATSQINEAEDKQALEEVRSRLQGTEKEESTDTKEMLAKLKRLVQDQDTPKEELEGYFHFVLSELEKREIPSDRLNFDIEVDNSDPNNILINLVKKEGQGSISINSFLPRGYKVKYGQHLGVNHWLKSVDIERGAKDKRGFLLTIGHEIGHSRQGNAYIKPPLIDRATSGVSKSVIEESIDILKFKAVMKAKAKDWEGLKGVNEEIVRKQEELHHATKPEYVIEAKAERNANAFALKMFRSLEENGYNVFDIFDSDEERKLYQEIGLVSYYKDLVSGKPRGEKEWQTPVRFSGFQKVKETSNRSERYNVVKTVGNGVKAAVNYILRGM